MYTANQIASWFLVKLNTNAGDTISPLKLQKLVYYAQAWHLVVFDKPLFDDTIEAWTHGPTIPAIYKRFNHVHRESIPRENLCGNGHDCPDFPFDTEEFLEDIRYKYGERSAGFLEAQVCREVPWRKARRKKKEGKHGIAEITRESMRMYYSQFYKKCQTCQTTA